MIRKNIIAIDKMCFLFCFFFCLKNIELTFFFFLRHISCRDLLEVPL